MEAFERHPGVKSSPFIKWAGGKTQLLRAFDEYLPRTFGTYFEPFLGGGAVFFHLFSTGRIEKAVLSDLNSDLIDCYLAIRDDLDSLLHELHDLQHHAKDERYYYEVARRRFNEIKLRGPRRERVAKSALFLFLNKTCFNGLYRVNRKGEFNVPWGDYKSPRIYDKRNLEAVRSVLGRPSISVECRDYMAVDEAKQGDFIYFDPPYQPLSTTSNFTSYTRENFGRKDQENLARLFHELAGKKCLLMLSNSPEVSELYEGHGYRLQVMKAGRAINSVAKKRGPVDELLVMNY